MTKYIGRKVAIGIGKESTRGTAVAPSFWIPGLAPNHEDKREYAMNESQVGSIMGQQGAEIVKEWGEGGYDALIGSEHFGLMLLSLLGSVSSAAAGGETVVYDHTFTLQEEAQHQSLTIATDEANGDSRFPNAMIDSLSVSYEKSKILDYSAAYKSVTSTSSTETVSYSAENIFRPQDFSLKIATNIAGLGAASEFAVRDFSLEFQAAVHDDDVLGDVNPQDFLNTVFMVTGSFTLLYDASTYIDLFKNGSVRAMRIALTNADVTIGVGSNPTLVIDLAKVIFNDGTNSRGLNDVVSQEISFTANYSLSDGKFGEIVLTNETASY